MVSGLFSATAYLLAAFLVALRLFHHRGPSVKQACLVAFVAIAFHLGMLTQTILIDPGQNMSMSNVASLIAWLITLTMTLASLAIGNAMLLPVVYGFAAIVVGLNLLLPDTYIMHIEMQPALLLHISLALFAYGWLIIALLYALQLAYINYRLKQRQVSLINSSLPPLMAVESVLFKILVCGTVLLTLSLVSGFVFLDDMFATDQAHKTVLSIMAWLVFCILLIGHQRWGWRGKPVISATIVGSVLLTVAYFGSRFVKEIILS